MKSIRFILIFNIAVTAFIILYGFADLIQHLALLPSTANNAYRMGYCLG
jgi:hypothetical protein